MGKDAIVLTKSAYQLESSDNFTVYTTQEHGSTVAAPQSVIDAVNALGPTAISSVGFSGEKTSLEDGGVLYASQKYEVDASAARQALLEQGWIIPDSQRVRATEDCPKLAVKAVEIIKAEDFTAFADGIERDDIQATVSTSPSGADIWWNAQKDENGNFVADNGNAVLDLSQVGTEVNTPYPATCPYNYGGVKVSKTVNVTLLPIPQDVDIPMAGDEPPKGGDTATQTGEQASDTGQKGDSGKSDTGKKATGKHAATGEKHQGKLSHTGATVMPVALAMVALAEF